LSHISTQTFHLKTNLFPTKSSAAWYHFQDFQNYCRKCNLQKYLLLYKVYIKPFYLGISRAFIFYYYNYDKNTIKFHSNDVVVLHNQTSYNFFQTSLKSLILPTFPFQFSEIWE
jgi:hypothetical protein